MSYNNLELPYPRQNLRGPPGDSAPGHADREARAARLLLHAQGQGPQPGLPHPADRSAGWLCGQPEDPIAAAARSYRSTDPLCQQQSLAVECQRPGHAHWHMCAHAEVHAVAQQLPAESRSYAGGRWQ